MCSDMPPFEAAFGLADIALDSVNKVRQDMPLWEQRRNDIYPEV